MYSYSSNRYLGIILKVVIYILSIFMYYPYIQKIYNYSISIFTEITINTYFTTIAQVILRNYVKSIAPYISS